MNKPLFRWTIGSCLPQGIEILSESINKTMRAFGTSEWDWAVCYNGLNRDDMELVKKAIGNKPVELISQDWSTCPVPDNCQSPKRKDGSFDWNGNKCGGTMWKTCPARMRIDSHEIIMDNDVVILKKFKQIDEFLESEKTLILEEPIRFYGRYDCLFDDKVINLNSGFMGMPPGYDFGEEIYKNWEKHGKYMNLSQSDEQGLLTYTLSQQPNIRIKKEQMVEVLHRDYSAKITGREESIHFVQSNRIQNHVFWKK